ncbi:hypothetical protein [Providencia alcalifaciens]|uniref:hypothetical protein n=1 Tax=Providencia alcalifaciens TaxID=126385 RepID=UPI0004522486|nr:hypothetical protein [Providencia alcalifaciens]EUD07286.1 putative lipoprotein [Providencia alcalifaciens R90-1475]
MQTKNFIFYFIIFISSFSCISISTAANSSAITDNGKTARLNLPVKATISIDNIIRNEVNIIPLSGLYEIIDWDKNTKKFKNHNLLFRVEKDTPSNLLFEIINDQYTCSYNNPNRSTSLPKDITVVNSGYSYKIAWSKGQQELNSQRSTTINDTTSWLDNYNKTKKFIDLTLNIKFPDISIYPDLINRGGFCRGNITMLVSSIL